MGFDRVFALKGGFREWVEAGYPIQEKESSTLGCLPCHRNVTPNVVAQWEQSKHSREVNNVSCSVCHGRGHRSADDVSQAKIPGANTCRTCHEEQGADFAEGKHALAREAVQYGQPLHWPSMTATRNRTECMRCHEIGLAPDLESPANNTSTSSEAACGSCHSSHAFSPREAASPRTCLPCHRPQWKAYSSSPHGERRELKRQGLLPEESRAPTCQTCHMQKGKHGVRTAWGSQGLKWPLSGEGTAESAARKDIFRALGYIDEKGRETKQFQRMQKIGIMRSSKLAWQKERIRMKKNCFGCHEASLIKRELDHAEDVLQTADLLLAKALRTVAESRDTQTDNHTGSDTTSIFPDLTSLYKASSRKEQLLGLMFRRHRMRAITGAFHLSPETAYHRGLDRMRLDLSEIRSLADERDKGSTNTTRGQGEDARNR
ncbi:MAG: multiheme c-type cytochrome [Desulfohalobiaceae bacterium]